MHDNDESLESAIRKNKQAQKKLEQESRHSDVIIGILVFLELVCFSLLCCTLFHVSNIGMLIFFILLIPDALIGVCTSLFLIYRDNKHDQALKSESDE